MRIFAGSGGRIVGATAFHTHFFQCGSARYATELSLPSLRTWPLGRYPHIVFYVETKECIDVWRVLHGARDIPVWMQETGRELLSSGGALRGDNRERDAIGVEAYAAQFQSE